MCDKTFRLESSRSWIRLLKEFKEERNKRIKLESLIVEIGSRLTAMEEREKRKKREEQT